MIGLGGITPWYVLCNLYYHLYIAFMFFAVYMHLYQIPSKNKVSNTVVVIGCPSIILTIEFYFMVICEKWCFFVIIKHPGFVIFFQLFKTNNRELQKEYFCLSIYTTLCVNLPDDNDHKPVLVYRCIAMRNNHNKMPPSTTGKLVKYLLPSNPCYTQYKTFHIQLLMKHTSAFIINKWSFKFQHLHMIAKGTTAMYTSLPQHRCYTILF